MNNDFKNHTGIKSALITGASVGLGREFALQCAEAFPEIEAYYLIARRADKLQELSQLIKNKKFIILPLDLFKEESFDTLSRELMERKPDIRLLINNSGCAYLGNVGEGELSKQLRMVDLNIKALTAITHLSVPYMSKGARIINVSSIAAFCANPRMTVYSASKSYVSAFSAGIREELKPRDIKVTVVCPGPMDTELIHIGNIKGHSQTFERLPYCSPKKVVAGALRASKRGKSVYTPRAFYKFYRLVAKLLPESLMIRFTRT